MHLDGRDRAAPSRTRRRRGRRARSRAGRARKTVVAPDHGERPARRRLGRSVRAAARQVPVREGDRDGAHHGHADEEDGPVAADQEQAADRRAERDAEVRRDPDRRVPGLVPLRRDEVGDHRLVGAGSDRAADAGDRRSGRDREARCRRRSCSEKKTAVSSRRAEQDQRPPADVVGQVPAEVPGREAGDRGDRNAVPSCLVVAPSSSTAQMPTKTQPAESAVEADERDRDHRPERAIDARRPRRGGRAERRASRSEATDGRDPRSASERRRRRPGDREGWPGARRKDTRDASRPPRPAAGASVPRETMSPPPFGVVSCRRNERPSRGLEIRSRKPRSTLRFARNRTVLRDIDSSRASAVGVTGA